MPRFAIAPLGLTTEGSTKFKPKGWKRYVKKLQWVVKWGWDVNHPSGDGVASEKWVEFPKTGVFNAAIPGEIRWQNMFPFPVSPTGAAAAPSGGSPLLTYPALFQKSAIKSCIPHKTWSDSKAYVPYSICFLFSTRIKRISFFFGSSWIPECRRKFKSSWK